MKKLILLSALFGGNLLAIDRLESNQDYNRKALDDAQTLAGLLDADDETFDKQAFATLRSYIEAVEDCHQTSIESDCQEKLENDWTELEANQDLEELSNVEQFILAKRFLGFVLRNAEEIWDTFK